MPALYHGERCELRRASLCVTSQNFQGITRLRWILYDEVPSNADEIPRRIVKIVDRPHEMHGKEVP
jgi:hypothetical protein